MTNEERLEMIKNESLIDALIYQLDMNLEGPKELVKDVRWLIEQAERAQELEKHIEDTNKVIYSMDKALEFYSGMTSDVAMKALAERIRKTLEGRR